MLDHGKDSSLETKARSFEVQRTEYTRVTELKIWKLCRTCGYELAVIPQSLSHADGIRCAVIPFRRQEVMRVPELGT